MNLKYVISTLIVFPILPLLYLQGKQTRKKIPRLPEAKNGSGVFTRGDYSPERSIKLIAIGESTIAGVGVDNHEEGLTGTLARELGKLNRSNVRWKVYARKGFTVKSITTRLLPKIAESDADLVIIGIGGNDAFKLTNPKKWKIDVTNLILILRIKFPDAVIVFCNMPPIKDFPAFTPLMKFVLGNHVEILSDELEKLVKQFDNVYYRHEKIVLKEWAEKLNKQPTDFFCDGIHPSKLTYQTWAKELAVGIKNKELLK